MDDLYRTCDPASDVILYLGKRVGIDGIAIGRISFDGGAGRGVLAAVCRGTFGSVCNGYFSIAAFRLFSYLVCAQKEYYGAAGGRRASYERAQTIAREEGCRLKELFPK